MRIQPFVLSLALASACTGGQGGDPGQSTGGSGAGGGSGHDAGGMGGTGGRSSGGMGGMDSEDCFGERREDLRRPSRSGSCTRGSGTYHCSCWEDDAGEEIEVSTVTADNCREALLEGCEIDIDAPRVCHSGPVGGCFTTDSSDAFRCQCAGSDAWTEVEAASCGDAVAELCATSCESDFGRCRQSISDARAFGCRCSGDEDNLQLAIGYDTCDDALARRCSDRCDDDAGGSCSQETEP